MSPHVTVTTTFASEEEAISAARALVEAGLAACVQLLGPIRSIYRWQGVVEEAAEWMCLVKTTEEALEWLLPWIQRQHPYENPEVTVTPITGGSDTYLAWLEGAVEIRANDSVLRSPSERNRS